MSETATPIVKNMKLLTLCTAISLFIVTGGAIYCVVDIFKNYNLPIPFPVNTALYSLFVLALLFAVFKMIMIYRNIPDNIESTLKHLLKELNIAYIIINALSIYAVITIGFTLFLSILEPIGETNGTYYGLEALIIFLARILEMIIIFIILLIPFIYPLVSSLINLIINIIIAVKFDSYYDTTHHPKIKDWFTFVSGSRLFLGMLMIFSLPFTKLSLKDIPLIICLMGFTLYSIFILLLIRYYGKLIDKTNPVIAVPIDIADTEVIGYEELEQYSNNNYDINN